jgi:hypothetical protein
MTETGQAAGAGGVGPADERTETSSPTAQQSPPVTAGNGDAAAAETGGGGRTKAAAVAAGTGAAVAGIAGGILVAARDTRRRVLGVPLGKRSRFQRTAGTVVDKVQEPARKLGSRFSRDKDD